MTTLTTAKAITLSFAIGLAYTAAAESFNDRGEDFLTQSKPGLPSSAAVEVVASPSHFNDRSGDFPTYLKSGPRVLQQAVAVTPSHFNDRGDPDRSLAPVLTGTASLTAGPERSAPRVRTPASSS